VTYLYIDMKQHKFRNSKHYSIN